MAARPKAGARPDGETIAGLREEAGAESFMVAYELSEKIRALGGAARASLARRQESGEWGHIKAMAAEHFDLDRIAQEYGGGHYRIQVYGTREDGTRGWLDGMGGIFDIEGAPLPIRRGPAEPAAAPPAAAMGADQVMALASKMTETMMGAITAALGAIRPAPAADPIQILRTAKELFAPAPAADGGQLAREAIANWQAGVAVGRTLENPPEGDSYAGVLREALPIVGDLARAFSAGGPRRPPELPSTAAPALAAPSSPAGTAPGPDPRPAWLARLWPFLPLIGGLASSDFNPESAAGMLLDKLTDLEYESVGEDAETPGFLDRTMELLPNALVAPHGPWLRRVLAAIHRTIEEEAAGEGQDAPVPIVGEREPAP